MERLFLGSREIRIQSRISTPQQDAVLLCFQRESQLELYVSDVTPKIYEGIIYPDHINMVNSCPSSKVNALVRILFEDMEGVPFSLEDVDNGIKLTIRQKMESGIVKLLWSGVLTITENNSSSYLSLFLTLGENIRKEKESNLILEKKLYAAQSDLRGWKDTAERLSLDNWQIEKDQLIQNFWVLYEKAHNELVRTHQDLQQLEDRYEAGGIVCRETSRQSIASQHIKTKLTRGTALDDHDEMLYDDTTIDRLAAGRPVVEASTITSFSSKVESLKFSTLDGDFKQSKRVGITSRCHGTMQDENQSFIRRCPSTDDQETIAAPPIEFSERKNVALFSAKELFDDLANSKRRREVKTVADKCMPEETSSIPMDTKRTKISEQVDETRRKELEKMAAILGGEDDDDDDDDDDIW
jgi:hypothetical protein